MSTLLYSPAVQIRIKTAAHGIIDVSDDIQRGNLGLRQNQPHSLSFVLLNPKRKYDRIFTPNDRIIVRLKKLRWLQVFSGYLNQVPFFSAFPGSITLTASCTAKRLQYTYWDPGYQETVNFLNALTAQSTGQTDSGLSQKAVAVLTEIANWPGDKVHIGRLPEEWVTKIDALALKLGPAFAVPDTLLGSGSTVAGTTLSERGTTGLKKPDGTPDVGEGYGAFKGTAGTIRGYKLTDNNSVSLDPATTSAFGKTVLTRENRSAPFDQFYCALDLPWYEVTSPSRKERARQWWTNKKVLVINAKTNASIVVRLADYKPGASLWTSQKVLDALGAKDGDPVSWLFADQAAPAGSTGGKLSDTGSFEKAPDHPIGIAGNSTGGSTAAGAPTTTAAGDVKVSFEGADSLKGNVRAARDFVKANWPVLSIGGYSYRVVAGTNTLSDHAKGLALDLMVSSGVAEGTQKALGNSLAMWFAANPGVFGTRQVIWFDRINDGSGWRPYTAKADASSANQRHANHVHVSFKDTGQTSAGPAGQPWPGSSPQDFEGGFATGGSPGAPAGGAGTVLTNAYNWYEQGDPVSNILAGPRRMMNDEPVLPMIATLMSTSQRMWCTAPNGDFIGWFPDYFGHYGLAGAVDVRPIELVDLTMTWNDERLKTHFFTAGSTTGYGSPTMEQEVALRKFQTTGIASVEFPEILSTLLNVNPDDPASAGWMDSNAILQRFGARPEFRPMGTLAVDGRAEFWYALHLFRENWANQFSAQAKTTFMPEMWPGTLMRLPDYGIQFYVEGVDHSWDFSEGGGFNTSTTITSPSALDGSGFYGLPRGGEQEDPFNVRPPEPGVGITGTGPG